MGLLRSLKEGVTDSYLLMKPLPRAEREVVELVERELAEPVQEELAEPVQEEYHPLYSLIP